VKLNRFVNPKRIAFIVLPLPAKAGARSVLRRGASHGEAFTGLVNSPEFQARIDQVIAAGPFVP